MLKQTQQQLTDLNKAYFDGELAYNDYRRKRGLLLDRLIDDITIPRNFISDTVPAQKPSIPSSQPIQASDSSYKFIIFVIAILIICIIIAVSFLIHGESIESNTKSLTNTSVPPKLQLLIEDSLRTNKWTTARLNEIESQWNILSPAERSKARQLHWHPKLIDELNSLASEQQALVDLGKKEAAVFEQQIRRLTVTLNLD